MTVAESLELMLAFGTFTLTLLSVVIVLIQLNNKK
ncbi:MAG: putative holin-like toxin [Streptococcaceae bacterium]|nr:putative holin-like toxin [Streptococcaceae bacterium]